MMDDPTASADTPLRSRPPAPDAGRDTHPVIVLDGRVLDEPVEDALRKLRENPQVRGARILVISPDEENRDEDAIGPILLPQPLGRAVHTVSADLAGVEVDEAIHRTGRRWLLGEEVMAQWIRELHGLIRELGEEIGDAVAPSLRRLSELCDWMEETAADLRYLAGKASQGMELLNTAELIRDAAAGVHEKNRKVDLQLPALQKSPLLMGQASALRRAFGHAIEAVVHRIGGNGMLRIDVEEGTYFILHRFCGRSASQSPELAAVPKHLSKRLEHLVKDVHGGRVFVAPDSPGEAGLIVALPTRRMEAEILFE